LLRLALLLLLRRSRRMLLTRHHGLLLLLWLSARGLEATTCLSHAALGMPWHHGLLLLLLRVSPWGL